MIFARLGHSTMIQKMTENEKLKLLAKDLTNDYPRSPRELLAGYVVAARTLDKCRAVIAGTQGEYHFNCPLDGSFSTSPVRIRHREQAAWRF